MKSYATVAQPLTKLTLKQYNTNFIWIDECTAVFEQLKQLHCSAPILCYPDFDREFVLQADASDVSLGVPQVPPTNGSKVPLTNSLPSPTY